MTVGIVVVSHSHALGHGVPSDLVAGDAAAALGPKRTHLGFSWS